jgi:riboflavin kinase / FMN adenylyltransferase
MHHYWSLEAVHLQNAWLTIGSFDGVHRGHQEIIRKMTAGAHTAGAPAVVLAFFPHPAVVLRKRHDLYYLTTPEERAEIMEGLNVDVVITHPFNLEIANMEARQFLLELKAHLALSHLWVGYDFALGRDREGDVPTLKRLGTELGYQLHVVKPVEVPNGYVSSSLIRKKLAEGDMNTVTQLLGRQFQIEGAVIHGDGRGKALGIPTANLEVWPERALPKEGVYVCRAHIGDESWGALANIGVRPTFEAKPVSPRVEAHLLDFDRDLYGQSICLEFIARLRDEQRFPNVQALVAQIEQDILRGREILSSG